MRIIGPPSTKYRKILLTLGAWRRSGRVSDLFVDEMFHELWLTSERYHIDPVGVVAQSIKETGGGKFSGRVPPLFYNTCGLKIRHLGVLGPSTDGDFALAHQMFPNWAVGALAHVQHVCAYAGWMPNEIDLPIVDPRYELVVTANGTTGRKPMEDWSELGGRWAPSPTYGSEIETIMKDLQDGVVTT